MMTHGAKIANFRCTKSMTPLDKGQILGGSTFENKLQGMYNP